MSALWTVRARLIDRLRSDATLGALLNAVHDGEPQRGQPPMLVVANFDVADWGTKDQTGGELRQTLVLTAGTDRIGAAQAALAALVPGLRGPVTGGIIVGARLIAGKAAQDRKGLWRQANELRLRWLDAA